MRPQANRAVWLVFAGSAIRVGAGIVTSILYYRKVSMAL